MSEYELYTRILAPRLQPKNQTVLLEETENGVHKADIVPCKKIVYTLYRYDQKEQGPLFFPFFNNTHEGENGPVKCSAPDGLLKFCDYILLAEKNKILYVLLLEMKSGGNGDAYKQLDSSAVFMEYVKNTAVRISVANDYLNFTARNVKVRKVVLKPTPKVRPLTNTAKSKTQNIDLNASPIYFPSDTLPLLKFRK